MTVQEPSLRTFNSCVRFNKTNSESGSEAEAEIALRQLFCIISASSFFWVFVHSFLGSAHDVKSTVGYDVICNAHKGKQWDSFSATVTSDVAALRE